ncbi:hypothetical protein LTR70_003071 [Exophiala xenobiotica]|uniref:Origin recognition complex subunit 5 n=1 Tax=Lithohypha guttulata TaxID=1690604 RepID=A0ABR0KHA2_9EURO|nr:hypothetical protein LTR24_002696 [Lithohypha guttulata]KAK5323782.1 hypothetical protein LTR70_003071 [Exophiala xenobiotica]
MRKEDQVDRYDRLDSINALGSSLKRLLQHRKEKEKLVVIIVGADQQRGATPTLFPALARLGDLIPCLSLILTSSSPRPLVLHKAGVPYIHFPPYKRNEAIQILLRQPPPLLPNPLPDYSPRDKDDQIRTVYAQFATVVYDTLIAPTTDSLTKYRHTCEKLWPRFIWPLISSDQGDQSWSFARLLSKNRILFQADGERALQDRLIPTSTQPSTFADLIAQKTRQDPTDPAQPQPPLSLSTSENPTPEQPSLLAYLPTILLLASYLASHTHPRHDIVLFSRLSTASSTNRRKKKYLARSRAGGISKNPTPTKKSRAGEAFDDDGEADGPRSLSKKRTRTPAKDPGDASATASKTPAPKKERADRSMRAILEKTSHIARPFTLERAIAIVRAIHPDGIRDRTGIADTVYVQLGALERLRVVVRAAREEKGDIMEEQWRCVVGREWVVEAGRRWGVGIEGWEVE